MNRKLPLLLSVFGLQILRRGRADFIVMAGSHALLRTRVEKSSTDENSPLRYRPRCRFAVTDGHRVKVTASGCSQEFLAKPWPAQGPT